MLMQLHFIRRFFLGVRQYSDINQELKMCKDCNVAAPNLPAICDYSHQHFARAETLCQIAEHEVERERESRGRSNNSSSNLATRNMHTTALVTRLSCTRISNGEYCILLRTCTCTRLNVLVLVLYAACDYGTWINRKCQRLKTIVLMYPLWFDGETTCFRLSSHCCWELAKWRIHQQ